jgi:epoxyqueuosine reductase
MIDRLREASKGLGFLAVGFSSPETPVFFDRFRDWIASGAQGEMSWLERHLELRRDPRSLLKGCSTLISLAYPYPPIPSSTPDGYTTARYAEPHRVDYHVRVRAAAAVLAEKIKEWFPGERTRICVDSAPLLERSFAYTSGLGFIGKNNMLILPGYGSYCFLAEILTTAPLDRPPVQPVTNGCGTCSRCLEACPTGALERPYRLNASRCLSYLTIEYKGKVGFQSEKESGNSFFGCDLCQEACPYNPRESPGAFSLPSTEALLAMGEAEFEERFGKSVFRRAGLEKLKENIQSVRGAVHGRGGRP